MEKKYSQWVALMAITKASFKATLKSPQTLFFSVLFPLIFVLIFGSFRNGGFTAYKLAVAPGSDTSNMLYAALKQSAFVKLIGITDTAATRKQLEEGDIAGILTIVKKSPADSLPAYDLKVKYTNATEGEIMRLRPFFQNISYQLTSSKGIADIDLESQKYSIREFKQIDFVLPGQIGFSLLFSTLFGIAFAFFNMRDQLILKRFYATPVKRINILIGIGSSRIGFQLLSVIVLIVVGHFFLGFTLMHGWVTFVNMLVISLLMLFLLMGVGLIISSVVKSDTTIPLIINIFSLPQMLVSGTFFPIEVFPKWMQAICRTLPLTHFNDAMRKISFEGASLIDCNVQIGVLLLWSFLIYVIVIKVFKWE